MLASESADHTHPVRSRLAHLLSVLAVALTLIAISASMPDAASATQKGRMSEGTAIRRCLAAGGSISWQFYDNGIDADMICKLPSGRSFFCVPTVGPFANIVYCF